MNNGNIATSRRLQDTRWVLRDGMWHSTRDIAQYTNSVAVHSDIAGLRANGIAVDQRQEGKIHYYRLTAAGPQKEMAT